MRFWIAAAALCVGCSAPPPSSGPVMPGETTGHVTGTISYSDGTGGPFMLTASAVPVDTQIELIAADTHDFELRIGWDTLEVTHPAFIWTPTQWEFVKFQYPDSRQPTGMVIADAPTGWLQFDQVSPTNARGSFFAQIKQATLKGTFDTRLPSSSSPPHS